MKTIYLLGASLIVFSLMGLSTEAAEDGGLESLRGSNPLEEESRSPTMKKWVKNDDPIERDYVQQPPLIPHSIKGYKINVKFNKCLTCHSWANYKEAKATKISQTHFSDRENNVMANIAARRYFCTQCHVPQTDVTPLVENTFESLRTIKRAH